MSNSPLSPGQIEKLISPTGHSWASSPGAAKSFRGNRSRDTNPEVTIRRILHAAGLRYRVGTRPDPNYRGTADLVFRKARVAVFIDGCYWHGCPEHYKPPTAHSDYWAAKIERNLARDRAMDAHLQKVGWLSLRLWEHLPPHQAASLIRTKVQRRQRHRSGAVWCAMDLV